jgi:hypothetical protein
MDELRAYLYDKFLSLSLQHPTGHEGHLKDLCVIELSSSDTSMLGDVSDMEESPFSLF